MRAIDTFYNGDYFRSRLEARWAVFFNNSGIRYIYEPIGFRSPNDECYLPDFYLPHTFCGYSRKAGLYIEIKPFQCEISAAKWFEDNLILLHGKPIDNIWNTNSMKGDGAELLCYKGWDYAWDCGYTIWICNECGTSKIAFNTSKNNYCPVNDCDGKCNNDILKQAAIISYKKRFEHNYIKKY